MKSSKSLKEIKITPSTVYIQMISPSYGQIFVDGKPIGVDKYGENYFLNEYDEDVYIRYGISFDADDDDEEYYPVEESKKLVQILFPKLKHLGAKIIDNGYGVELISIPKDKVQNITRYDYPKYLGNGVFEYKDKTITYKQSAPGSNTYQIYDSNDNLIRTVNSVNKDFESYMGYLEGVGKYSLNWNQQVSPYDVFQSLTEIKIQPTGAVTLSPDILAAIKDDVISYITDELNDTIYDLLDYYFDSHVIDTFESFIIDQMIFNNYSITRNGKEILMSHNTNRDLITEEDIREYIDGNLSLQKYLKDLIYKFYIKNVDVECLTRASIAQAMKDKQESEGYGEEYSIVDVSNSVQYAFYNSDCDSTYIGDVLDDNDFEEFLRQEFKQADVIEEIQVTPHYTFGDNPKTLNGTAKVETDMFGKGYTLALVDLGSHYTFIPYGGQPFVVLIPKQYIEPLEKEYYPISQDGVQQLKDLLRQGKIEKAKSIEPANGVVSKIKEALKKKIKTKLNESETAYHGTSHYFTSFRKEGIGGGSGAQAYGWGLYFGKDPAIAKSYVGAGSRHGKTKPLFQGKTAEELGFQYENEIFFGLPSGMTTAQDYINYAQEMISILEEEADFDGKNEILESYRQFIDIIKDLEIEQEPMLYLYKVTLFPNKTPDYLNWDSDVPQSQLDKINQQAQKDNLDIQVKPNLRGSTLYGNLQKYFDSPKEASMFLLKAGIDGVTHSNGTVRIVFDDLQVQIDKIYKSKEIDDVKENKKSQLNEYSDKIVNQMIAKFQKEMRNTLSTDDIKAKLNRFDQIKQNIPAKVKSGQIVLPDKFTKPDPNTNKVLNPQDILAYTWKDLETVLDAYGEKAEKTSKDFATVQDAEFVDIKGVPVVYSGDGIKVYEGSTYGSCVKLNYAFKYKGEDDKIYTYGFCIGRKEEASNQYYSYRFGRGGSFRSFYFVADTTQNADIKGNPQDRNNFLNWYHFFVIHTFDNDKFGVTDAVNAYGSNHEITGVSWEDIGKFMIKNGGESGKKAWDKIKNHKDIFKYVAPPSEETDQALIRDQILNVDQFKNLNRNQKRIYISRRADQPNAFNSEMFKVLDPELKNLALRSGKGFIPTFDDLKGSQALLRSYASFRFTRAMDQIKNNQSTPVIVPLPFVPYLNDSEKQQYLETFDGNLTFQYIEKYFGENAARTYVNEQAKDLKFLPAEAVKYIQDPKLKQLYGVYAKLLEPWQYGYDTNISEEELEKKSTMPLQTINPIPLNKEQWTKLSSAERKAILDLTEKFNGKSDYLDFLYALPIIVKDGNNRYVVLPENTDDINTYVLGKWELVDENGNVIKDISGESSIGDLYFSNWYPDASNEYKKVYNINDLKVA